MARKEKTYHACLAFSRRGAKLVVKPIGKALPGSCYKPTVTTYAFNLKQAKKYAREQINRRLNSKLKVVKWRNPAGGVGGLGLSPEAKGGIGLAVITVGAVAALAKVAGVI
jgi:hypothetical protein